jgi:hypothetical protein
MTQAEAEDFLREVVFVAFPTARNILQLRSGDPAGTFRYWAKTLTTITFQEGMSVVHRWTMGELPAPTEQEMESFALHIRGVVMMDRAKIKRTSITKDIKPDHFRPSQFAPIAEHYAKILEASKRYQNNEITLEQCRAIHADIIADHAAKAVANGV